VVGDPLNNQRVLSHKRGGTRTDGGWQAPVAHRDRPKQHQDHYSGSDKDNRGRNRTRSRECKRGGDCRANRKWGEIKAVRVHLADGKRTGHNDPQNPRTHAPIMACRASNWQGSGFRAVLRSLFDERACVLERIKRPQILELLTDPDQLDGNLQFARDRQRDAAFRAPIKLCKHNPIHRHRPREQVRLAQPVLSRRRVERKQRLVRSAVELLWPAVSIRTTS
jgi:hypothetical protein